MIVTIHQPDFMPWLGFFAKIKKSDCWIVLDHVHNNPRDAAFWGRRVKILSNTSYQWLSLPVEKPKEPGVIGLPINQMKYSTAKMDVYTKAKRTIENVYSRTQFYKDYSTIIDSILLSKETNLCKRNMQFILNVLDMLDIKPTVVFSSSLGCTQKGNDLLIEILKKVGASKYICGDGASGYQDASSFEANGIQLEYNNFKSSPYFQINQQNFISGLSVIDALMNVGAEKAKSLIKL